MPLTVITLKNCPPSLRGDLSKWMQEIATGVYVGNFNTRVREELWKRVVASVGIGEATMAFAARTEIGYNFSTHNSHKIPIDYDGIPLVFSPKKVKKTDSTLKHGFSKAAKMRQAKKYSARAHSGKTTQKPYVVLDLETTGLDPLKDQIIEIGALKVSDKIEEFTCLVKCDKPLSTFIQELTGISKEQLAHGLDESSAVDKLTDFIGDSVLVGYNLAFDLKFINQARKRQGRAPLSNKTYDVMKYAKQEKMFLKNYKLQTVLEAYGIIDKVPHRALDDAKIISKLVGQIKSLSAKLGSLSPPNLPDKK